MNIPTPQRSSLVLTVGHSMSGLDAFIRKVQEHGVERIVDIRPVPWSSLMPQFNRKTLTLALHVIGVAYLYMPGLGGLRCPGSNSPNTGWRNVLLRGFADYMGTEQFETQLDKLIKLTKDERIALMCTEAMPSHCHRMLISDALAVRGILVEHILTATSRLPHIVTPWAHVEGRCLIYPSATTEANARTNHA